MTPIKELGACGIGPGDRDFLFRPSFRNMARSGEPEALGQAWSDRCTDAARPCVPRAAAAARRGGSG
ncbi:hypothetical protein Q6252_29190, partial [Klebsiella pneumoniae]|nr:hypothetical protein [Klebsiella pneumoniae]